MADRISLGEASNLIEQHVRRLKNETVAVSAGAFGRYLSETIFSLQDSPRYDCSAMDGYAIRLDDAKMAPGVPPRHLVIGTEVSAACPPGSISQGQAIPVNTGSPIPEGADRVVPRERVRVEGQMLAIENVGRPEQNIRKSGEDFRDGDAIAKAGDRLSPELIGALVACGIKTVLAWRRPRLELVMTGSEFLPTSEFAQPARLDSNTPMLAAFCHVQGWECRSGAPVADDPALLRSAFEAAIGRDADILVSTGGASGGAHDHVRAALESLGARIIFHGVAMRPGKPMLFAVLPDGRPFFGLPGNPVAALVGFRFFVAAAARRMEGCVPERGRTIAPTGLGREGLALFLAATIDSSTGEAAVIPGQRSHLLRPLLGAEGWVLIQMERGTEKATYHAWMPSREPDRVQLANFVPHKTEPLEFNL